MLPKDANKVFILGAGASAADGAPLQAGLFRKYAEIIQHNQNNYIHASSERDLRTFFYSMWGANIDNANLDQEHFPTFEEALGLLELANARNEFFKNFGGLHTEATFGQEIRAHLVNLIAIVLDATLKGGHHTHRNLLTQLQAKNFLSKTTFLSFNYDLLIDNALREVTKAEPDYAATFRDYGGKAPTPGSSISLLKIHGSLNWLYCPTCGSVDLFPGEKIVYQIIHNPTLMTCNICQEPRVPIVVPPTFFKVMSNFCLQQIWKKAEEALREANHLIFCGYSFPDADLHFKYLLKRAEINRPPHHPLEVFVVSNHPTKQQYTINDENARYVRFFRNKLVRWTKLSFSDLSANPDCYADPANWI
jgi:NAD-dependent SIR2 family protein deacetylase